jgi:hypothetical protein
MLTAAPPLGKESASESSPTVFQAHSKSATLLAETALHLPLPVLLLTRPAPQRSFRPWDPCIWHFLTIFFLPPLFFSRTSGTCSTCTTNGVAVSARAVCSPVSTLGVVGTFVTTSTYKNTNCTGAIISVSGSLAGGQFCTAVSAISGTVFQCFANSTLIERAYNTNNCTGDFISDVLNTTSCSDAGSLRTCAFPAPAPVASSTSPSGGATGVPSATNRGPSADASINFSVKTLLLVGLVVVASLF